MSKGPTLLIVGHGRHGKDTLAESWRDTFGMAFESSSYACAEIFIFEALKDKYGYKNLQECFDDRSNHRAEWHDMIAAYNTPEKSRLGQEIVDRTGCYVGMRNNEEIQACMSKGIFDLIVCTWQSMT